MTPNRCDVCGRFLPNVDLYADSHVYREHPDEYQRQRADADRRYVASLRESNPVLWRVLTRATAS